MMRCSLIVVSVSFLFCVVHGQQESPPEVREYDWILLKGADKWLVGTVVKETDRFYFVKLRDYASEAEMPIPKERVVEIRRRQSLEEAFNLKLSRAKKTPEAYISVARWALGYPQLFEKTKEILVKAVKMRPKTPEPYLMLLNFIRQDCAEKARPMTEDEKNILLDTLEAALPLRNSILVASYASMVADAGLPSAGYRVLKEFYDSLPDDAPPSHRRLVEITLAEIALGMGKFESARMVLNKILEREPDSFRALLLSAKVALESGRLNDAEAFIEHLRTYEPPYWEVFMLEGAVAFEKGLLDNAEEAFLKALSLRSPIPDIVLDLAEVLILEGKVYTAKRHLQTVSETKNWRYYYLNALVSRLLNESISVVGNWLRQAAEADGAHPLTYCQLASFLLVNGDVNGAREWAKKALKSGFDPVASFRLLAKIESADGNDEAAERTLLYALAASPEDVDTLYTLAEASLSRRRYNEALSYLGRVMTLRPDHLPSLKSLAYINYSLNRFEEAVGYLQRASAFAKINDAYILRLGKALYEIENLLCWRDIFKRADSTEVANGWTEEEVTTDSTPLPIGVEIKIEKNRLVMEGKQDFNGDVLLLRPEKTRRFVRFEAMLDFSEAGGVNCGLKILVRGSKSRKPRAWIALWRDTQGRLRYNYSDTGAIKGELEETPDCGLCSDKARLAIELADMNKSIWVFYVDGEKVGEVQAEGIKKYGGGEILVAIFGRAPPPRHWRLACDYVHIFRRKKSE